MSERRPYVRVVLSWEDERERPAFEGQSRGLTAFRADRDLSDLFSVYAELSADASEATVFALSPSMDERLPAPGGTLVLTAGSRTLARARVTGTGEAKR